MPFGPTKKATMDLDDYALNFIAYQLINHIWLCYHPIWEKLANDKECRRQLINNMEDAMFAMFDG